jgi:protein-S-isoprenylcysteine O-methyltransferase Ste14
MVALSAFLIALSMGIYGWIHSWLASTSVKSRLEQNNPTFYRKYYRFTYSVVGAISLIPVGIMVLILPDQFLYRIPSPWVFLTLLLQLLALVLAIFAFRGTNTFTFLGLSPLIQSSPLPESLNTNGLYRFVRHPIYSLGLVIIWLFPWMTTNLLALFLSSTAYIVVGAILEEKKLRVQFSNYAEYQKQVPMFIPKILR